MIVTIKDKQYLMEKRQAKVGETILLNHSPLRVTQVDTVFGLTVVDIEGKENFHQDYIVLVELENETK